MGKIEDIRKRHKLDDKAEVKVISTAMTFKTAESDPYKFTARITTDALDRQQEVVIPRGGNLTEFYNSGMIAWNHDYSNPVALPNKEKRPVYGEDFIECGGMFLKRPNDYEGDFFPDFARAFVTQAIEAGINPGVSIGFIPLESRVPTKSDREKWGADLCMVHNKWKLLEFSIAPVQANQEAVITAIGKGLIARDVAKAVGIEAPETTLEVVHLIPKTRTIRETICITVEREAPSLFKSVQSSVNASILKQFGRIYED